MILNSTRNVQPASEGGGVDLDHDRHSGAFEFDIGVGPPDPIQVVMGISVSKSLTQTTDAPTDCSEPQYYVVHLCGETVRSNPEFDPIRASWRSRCHDACVDSIKSGGHKSGIVIHRLSVSISFMRMQLQTVFGPFWVMTIPSPSSELTISITQSCTRITRTSVTVQLRLSAIKSNDREHEIDFPSSRNIFCRYSIGVREFGSENILALPDHLAPIIHRM